MRVNFDEYPTKGIMKDEDVKQIHAMALRILEEIGVMMDCPQALDILEKENCQVDRESKIVKFLPQLVLDAVQSAPETFRLWNRSGTEFVEVGGDSCDFVPAVSLPNMLVSNDGDLREGMIDDLIKITHLENQIEQYRILAPAVLCADIPPQYSDFYRDYVMMKYSEKPHLAESFGTEGVEYLNRLMVALRGSQVEAEAKPHVYLGLCPISPLKWSNEAAQNIIDGATFGIPLEICSCPFLAFASPVTVAGAVAEQTAEFLSGLVLAQVVRKGIPVMFGGYTSSMDMKTMVGATAAIESMLAVAAHGQMAKYYKVPSMTFGACSEAKTVDYQSGYEDMLTSLVAVEAGFNMVYGPGAVDYFMDFSCEKLLLNAEIIKMMDFYRKGVEVNEETLAWDTIKEVGPGGSFMMSMHTLSHFRDYQLYPDKIIDRFKRDTWENQGRKTIYERTNQKVKEMLEQDYTMRLTGEVAERLDEVIKEINAELGSDLPLV